MHKARKYLIGYNKINLLKIYMLHRSWAKSRSRNVFGTVNSHSLKISYIVYGYQIFHSHQIIPPNALWMAPLT
jgi:hypothetical protein